MNINNRIKELVNQLSDGNISEFSSMIGVTNNVTINRIVKEKNNPGYNVIVAILQNIRNVNPYWLLLGEGEMFLPESEEMDYEKMKQGFSLDIKPQAATGSVIPSGVYQDTRKDLEREQRLHESERARVDKLIDALTSRDTHSDKSLIDYSRVGVRRDCGVLLEDEPAEKKRAAG